MRFISSGSFLNQTASSLSFCQLAWWYSGYFWSHFSSTLFIKPIPFDLSSLSNVTTSIFILVVQFNCLLFFSGIVRPTIGSSCSHIFPHLFFLNLLVLSSRFAVLLDSGDCKSHLVLIRFMKFFPFFFLVVYLHYSMFLFPRPFTVVCYMYSVAL